MSEFQPVTPSQIHSLSQAASILVGRIPELLHRLHALESEEARLNDRARQLFEQLVKDESPTRLNPTFSTPVSKARTRARNTTTDRAKRTPPHIDPRNIETPVKNFLLMESLALAMSVRSKRKGRIFLGGDSTEFGERR